MEKKWLIEVMFELTMFADSKYVPSLQQVVSFVDYGMERKEIGDALVIMKSPTEKDDQFEDLPRIGMY